MKEAISVYLSPHAEKVLNKYVEESKYSVSRTVEEIILAFHDLDVTIKDTSEDVPISLFLSIMKRYFRRLRA